MTPQIELAGVNKYYGAFHALKNIDLSIAKGTFVALVGPSGCGKSTLLRSLAGLETISDGSLKIAGEMMNGVVTGALRASWKLPFIGSVTSRRPIVLLYHGTPPRRSGVSMPADAFEQHIQFLTRHFECVPIGGRRKRRAFDRIQVAVTFDDGFRNNATIAAPILRKYRVPATFFLCSRHAEPNGYLWFAYLEALEENFRGNGFSFRGQFMDMSPGQRPETMARLREWLLELTPHPAAMYSAIESELPQLEDFISSEYLSEHYAGMTENSIAKIVEEAETRWQIMDCTVIHRYGELARVPQPSPLALRKS